ncbi:MAG: hypothetical protein IPH07_05295 [Deltaproteobacteria bacterium]|nr:hypothetical protein [Deltaproteobacteria bacterium]MBK8719539.1 hypothetical protein [Deltaproteobacteria bacterium]MBP7287504.1 hypothetical protein [Nannocystaceae bacterium]
MSAAAPHAIESTPSAWLELRDCASAAQFAAALLCGPLAPFADPPPSREQLLEILTALDRETRRVCALVNALQPAANERPAVAVVPSSLATPPIAATASPVVAPASKAAARRVRAAEPAAGDEVDAILQAVELELLSRAQLMPTVEVGSHGRARVAGAHGDLAPVLVQLLLDAAALGPADPGVQLRVFTDLAEDLGDATCVVFEVRPDPRAPGSSWPTHPQTAAGIAVMLGRRGARPFAQLRVPALRP